MITLTNRGATQIPHGIEKPAIRRHLASQLLKQLDNLMDQVVVNVRNNSDFDYTATVVTAFTIMIGDGQRVMFIDKGGDT